jgi:uncharacterized membrane protein
MANKKFSIGEALSFGWKSVTANLGLFLGIMVVWALLVYVPSAITNTYKDKSFILYALTFIVASAISLVVHMGLIKVMLDFHDGHRPGIPELFSCTGLFVRYAVASSFYNLIAAAGLLLLIVPGIIWMVQFGFYGYFIVDKTCGPIEALKKSAAITKGSRWDIFLFGLLFFGINILGILALFVGLLVTMPVTMLAAAFIYRKLLAATQDAK